MATGKMSCVAIVVQEDEGVKRGWVYDKLQLEYHYCLLSNCK